MVVAWKQSGAKMCRIVRTICRPTWTSATSSFWAKLVFGTLVRHLKFLYEQLFETYLQQRTKFSISATLQLLARICGEMLPDHFITIKLLPTLFNEYSLQFLHYYSKLVILCHANAVHNRNHNHSTHSYIPWVTTLSVQGYSYITCPPQHTISFKHTRNSSTLRLTHLRNTHYVRSTLFPLNTHIIHQHND
jgi:hypothetical protein